jgi:hypothetical protein
MTQMEIAKVIEARPRDPEAVDMTVNEEGTPSAR